MSGMRNVWAWSTSNTSNIFAAKYLIEIVTDVSMEMWLYAILLKNKITVSLTF